MNKQLHLNNSSFVGLDLSLSGSHIMPVGSSVNNETNNNTNNGAPLQTPKKHIRPSSNRSYIIPKTKSTENLAKKTDTVRSEKNVNNSIRLNSKTKYPVPTTPTKVKNEDRKVKESVDRSRQSNVFKQLTARTSYDDDSILISASQTITQQPEHQQNDKTTQNSNNTNNSMFLLDEFKTENKNNESVSIKPKESINNKNSMFFKDSLDVSNSIIKINNNIQQNDNMNEEEAWKNEMMIYEKYLKEDLEEYGKHLNELDNDINNIKASKIDNFEKQPQNDLKHSLNDSYKNNNNNYNNNSIRDKRMLNFNKNIINNEESKEKIEKLKNSVDHLRREFQTDIKYNNKSNDEVLHDIKRKISARKIQRWYRRHNLRKKAGEAALKRLMAQKKEELLNKEKEDREKQIQKEALIEKQRKEKASQMRQQKIKEMHTKREEAKINESIDKKNQLNVSISLKSSINKTFESNSKQKTKEMNLPPKSSRSDVNSIKTELLVDKSNQLKESMNNDNLSTKSESVSTLDFSTKSKTIDNLFETLKELEKVERFPSPPRSTNNLYESNDTIVEESSEKIVKNPLKDIKTAASMTNQKLNSILSFLDDVETVNTKNALPPKHVKNKNDNMNKAQNDLKNELKKKPMVNNFFESESQSIENENKLTDRSNSTINSTIKFSAPIVPSAEEIEELEKATQAAAEVTNTMLSQRLELEEKKRTISMLQKALNQQRELTVRHTKEADKELEARLKIQKDEYESTIQRHLSFIDQLIDDKKNLSEKCEKLVKELKEVDKKYSDRIRSLEETFRIETQKMKDMHEAAEKLRREKWMEEKAKKIKDMTVKGLEPEIQNMISKHKNEIKTIKAMHEAELLQADERASQRYIRMIEEMRQNFEQEKELCVNKEREMAKTRYEKSLQDEEKSFLEQRRRLYAEIEEEKNRIAEQGAKQRQELDKLRKNLEENNLNAIEAMKKEYETSRNEQEKRHQNEIKELKQRLEIEKQSWEENYMKKQENVLAQKERELRDQVKRDRDKEIELVISRLESETTLTRDEAERAAENRVKRIRDKYEAELREVEKTERETTERYNIIKAKYNELEGDHERLKVMLRQKDKELEDIHKITNTLQQERSRLADIIRQEFSDRLVFTEEESKRIKLEMAELKSKQQYELDKKKEEIERLQRDKDEELNKVHERIKQAIAKKEEAVTQLKQQYEAACKRADHLEGLLEQQRKLMVGKK